MFEVSLESEFISDLSQESRSWLARAIGVVILGDGQVDNEELISLRAAISFLEDESEIVELVTAVKSRSKLELGRIDERMDRAATIYFYLATSSNTEKTLPIRECSYLIRDFYIKYCIWISDDLIHGP